MAVYNFGSINLDHLYKVDHFVRPGETMASQSYQMQLGGKGANQSIALAKAGADVYHVGAVHANDHAVVEELSAVGVETSFISRTDTATGHAIIQLNKDAENAIILFAGANHTLSHDQVNQVLDQVQPDDWVLLQNETNQIDYIVQQANSKKISVAFNPAPMDVDITQELMPFIDLLIVNEVEAMDLMQVSSIDDAKSALQEKYPELAILMTLGRDGVRYLCGQDDIHVEAFTVVPVDTTAAGDTFIGFCLTALMDKRPIKEALTRACAASAICVTRLGAAPAIPTKQEVDNFLVEQ
ncbi:ribokinase [Marinomonas sp. 15G1-11]|uniref:Ribokinase n=1 Tax=Marinomonas phaeophyticola TaxID=3004091 RepID=A0ABT4JRI5_9GAMM|nr:ribokinase [Marinomonas sp. 15G1-11]MCZ2720632.1 ribokinase [Marinomonas sp. 15G1-11]